MRQALMLLAVGLCAAANVGSAAPLPVALTDPSFEATPTTLLPNLSSQSATFRGWFMDGSANANARVQPVNPGTFWGEITNRDGDKAAFAAQVATDASGAAVDFLGHSLYQTVELAAGVTYRLTVGIGTSPRLGNANTSGPFKNDGKWGLAVVNYPVTRAANAPIDPSSVLAESTGVVPTQTGTFADYSLEFTPATSGLYNLALQNRGYVPSTGDNSNQSTIFFDNVRLVQIPEPNAALLGLWAALGCASVSRRR